MNAMPAPAVRPASAPAMMASSLAFSEALMDACPVNLKARMWFSSGLLHPSAIVFWNEKRPAVTLSLAVMPAEIEGPIRDFKAAAYLLLFNHIWKEVSLSLPAITPAVEIMLMTSSWNPNDAVASARRLTSSMNCMPDSHCFHFFSLLVSGMLNLPYCSTDAPILNDSLPGSLASNLKLSGSLPSAAMVGVRSPV